MSEHARIEQPRTSYAAVTATRASTAVCLLFFVIAWTVGLTCRGYNYDEGLRAHSLWLTRHGLQPYGDFLECHPPYFQLLAWLANADADPGAYLQRLRLFASTGNALALLGLLALGAGSASPTTVRAALLLVAVHPLVAGYLIEFRVDGWGYAAVAWSMVWYLRRPASSFTYGAVFGAVVGLASFVLCPKAILAPVLLSASRTVCAGDGRSTCLRGNVGTAIGLLSAGVLVVGALACAGYDMRLVRDLVVVLNAAVNARKSYRFGLAESLVKSPILLTAVLAGILCWVYRFFKQPKSVNTKDPYLLTIGIWCSLEATLVGYPYRQYTAPWFLFGSLFIAVLCDAVFKAFPRRVSQFLPALTFLVIASLVPWTITAFRRDIGAWRQAELLRWMLLVALPEERIVAPPSYHPLFRRDVFYAWWNTFDPRGEDIEALSAALPTVRIRFEVANYRRELVANPPAFVVVKTPDLPNFYPVAQGAEIIRFLDDRGYKVVKREGLVLALRPDVFIRMQNSDE